MEIMKPRFSVIIATCNRNGLLVRALNSVFAQTYQNFEIIVTDDSLEGSAQVVIDEVKTNYENKITYLRSNGSRQAVARNMGFMHAAGDIITILDDDDEWLPNKLEIEYKYFQKYNFNCVLYGGRNIVNQNGTIEETYIPRYRLSAKHILKLFNFVAFPAFSFPRIFLYKTGLLDKSLKTHEDWDFHNKLSLYYKFIPIPEVLANIYKHNDNRDLVVNTWAGDKKIVWSRYKEYWNLFTYVLYFIRQTKLKLTGQKY